MARTKSLVDEIFFNEVEEALSTIKDNRIVLKLLTLRALKEHSYEEVSKIFSYSRISITKWIKSFKESGIEGLKKRPTGHMPSKLNSEQIKIIENWLLECKNSKGKFVNWTIEKLRNEILEVFGISVGKTPLWVRIKKMNFVLKSPRPEHHKSDKALQEVFKKNKRRD